MFQLFQPALAVFLYQCYTFVGSGGLPFEMTAQQAKMLPYFAELYKKEIEKKNPNYNPNPGYEPYWPQGTWVFEDDALKNNGTTTKMVLVCGEECNYLFRSVKHVCAKQAHALYSVGCTPNLFKTCSGFYPDYLLGFQTFNTYCQFLDAQCHSWFDRYWIFVHLGPCMDQEFAFKPLQGQYMFDRIAQYLSTLEVVFANASLPSPQGLTTTEPPTTTTKPKHV